MNRALLAGLALGVAACKMPAPPPPQGFAFRVLSDPDKPLAGADVRLRGWLLATSDSNGVAPFSLDGRDGDTFELSVVCPSGYESPVQAVAVALRRLASTDKVPEYDVACPPTTRSVVVAVNGSKGRRLPILQLGQEIARTDATGVATLLLRSGPQEQIDLTLDTTDPESADLRPQNPTATFVVRGRDDVFVFDPHFAVAKKRNASRPSARGATPKGAPMPIRIQ
jgi:hypothetical protein